MSAYSHAELWATVARVQAGDTAAYSAIYQHCEPQVYRFVLSRVKHRQTAEDLTGDTFVRAIRRIDSIEDQGRDIVAWHMTIARNVVADYYKAHARGEVLYPDFFDFSLDLTAPGQPDELVLGQLDSEAIADALARLTTPQREVVELRYLRELSTAESAAVLGKQTGATKAVLVRALTALRADERVAALS